MYINFIWIILIRDNKINYANFKQFSVNELPNNTSKNTVLLHMEITKEAHTL